MVSDDPKKKKELNIVSEFKLKYVLGLVVSLRSYLSHICILFLHFVLSCPLYL